MKKIQHIFSLMVMAAAMASCSQDIELEGGQGYISLNIQSFESTHTPKSRAAAPEGYKPKQLRVEIKNQAGEVVKSTDDYNNDQAFQQTITLKAGAYTIEAHSANWDGNGSGFGTPYYYGKSTFTVKPQTLSPVTVTCTQANVKLTVNYDQSIKDNFQSATTTITSSTADVAPLAFVMNQTTESGYIPANNFEAKLDITNKSGQTNSTSKQFTDVKPRDHFIINYKLKEEGHLGNGSKPGISVEVDESTNTYTYTVEISTKAAVSLTAQANAWSSFALLSGAVTSKLSTFDPSSLKIQWKATGTEQWTDIPYNQLTVNEKDEVSCTLKGLSPKTSYDYRLCYSGTDAEAVSNTVTFTTEEQVALYNGGFENWWMDGKVAYPNEQGTSFWDTSNKGGATFIGSNTVETTSPLHGGAKAAKIESKAVSLVKKFAAGSLYTGKFIQLVGTKGAKIDWGVPFTSRPTALKGYMQYTPANVDYENGQVPAGAPAKGQPDQCGMYIALTTEVIHADNTNMSTIPDWTNDPRVIAYGALPDDQNVNSNGTWKEVNIPLVYNNLTDKPTHLVVVFSSSKYGDYFHGGQGSILYVDDFSLEYGDNPQVKKP